MGRYSGDNETVSVSSASVSRPATAGKQEDRHLNNWVLVKLV